MIVKTETKDIINKTLYSNYKLDYEIKELEEQIKKIKNFSL